MCAQFCYVKVFKCFRPQKRSNFFSPAAPTSATKSTTQSATTQQQDRQQARQQNQQPKLQQNLIEFGLPAQIYEVGFSILNWGKASPGERGQKGKTLGPFCRGLIRIIRSHKQILSRRETPYVRAIKGPSDKELC